MDWIKTLLAKRRECEQHKTWLPYWDCLHRLEAGRMAFDAGMDDCLGDKAWEEYGHFAGKVISDKQYLEIEQLATEGERWVPPAEVEFEGDKLPLSAVLLIPYARAMRSDKEKSARQVVLLIDSNNRLTAENREVLRRALFNMCDIELVDEAPVPPDIVLFKQMRELSELSAKVMREHFRDPDEGQHVPKSQRQEFAQTRGPRPQHSQHFSKQNQRGRGNQMRMGRGRGR